MSGCRDDQTSGLFESENEFQGANGFYISPTSLKWKTKTHFAVLQRRVGLRNVSWLFTTPCSDILTM